MGIVIPIAFIIFVLYIIIQICNQSPLEKACVYCFTGQMGSGKSYLSVHLALKAYRRATAYYKRKKFIAKLFRKPLDMDKPLLLSLLPIGYWKKDRKTKKKVFIKISTDLTADHLLMKTFIPANSTILLEEAGTVFSQWSFGTIENETFGMLVRFYRQWIGFDHGLFIMNDQASSEVAKNIRVRCGIVYNLRGFSRWMMILPFYKVRYQTLLVSDDQVMNTGSTDLQKNTLFKRSQLALLPYLIGRMPYFERHYDTHAYKLLYYDMFGRFIPNDGSKVRDLIEIPQTYKKKNKV